MTITVSQYAAAAISDKFSLVGGDVKPIGFKGYLNTNGYWRYEFSLAGIRIRAYKHQVMWCAHKGEWPSSEIDHTDGDTSNNEIGNLRVTDRFGNTQNSSKRSHSTQPYKGVRAVGKGKWSARITSDKKHYHLGTFDTAEEAQKAYASAAFDLHREYARLS